MNSGEFDLQTAMDRTIRMLSRNPRGYFLMVEGDTHTDNVRRGLDRMVALEKNTETIAKMSTVVGKDTLLLFTADHSFDIAPPGRCARQAIARGTRSRRGQGGGGKASEHPDSRRANG